MRKSKKVTALLSATNENILLVIKELHTQSSVISSLLMETNKNLAKVSELYEPKRKK